MVRVLLAASGVLVLGASGVVGAQRTTMVMSIESQPLERAISAWAQQTGYQVLMSSGDTHGDSASAAVKGAYTPESALKMLLGATDLRYQFVNARTVAIVSARQAMVDRSEEAGPALRLTQVAQGGGSGTPAAGRRDEHETIEQVIVTAQKREERLLDVPISIVALGGEELERRKISDINDLAFAVPGLSIASSGTGQRRIALRGVSNVFGSSSLIGMYLDDAAATSVPAAQLDLPTYDLERIEVLRGPQGTLYGEGSVGGTIRFITRSPRLDEFALNADLAALFTQDGTPGQRIQSAVNIPVIQDRLGVRLAGTFDHEGGWIDQPATGRKNFNDQDLVNVRMKALWKPLDQLTVDAMAVVHRNNAAPASGEDANGSYTQPFNFLTTPSADDDYDIYNLTLSYDFSSFRILNTTSYLGQDKSTRDTGGPRQLFGAAPATAPLQVYIPDNIARNRFLTEELRLTSIGSGPWQWTFGGFYRRAKTFASLGSVYFTFPGPTGAPLAGPIPIGATDNSLSKSAAIFGDTSYKITDRFTLGSGLRYFEDRRDFTSGSGATATTQSGKFHSLNPRVYAEYSFTPQVNAYASAAKGFRSGGFNTPAGGVFRPHYDPESVWTYELGTKMSLAEGRLGTELSVFYSNYTDYQIIGFVLVGNSAANITSNAGDARAKGVEWALTWRPAGLWTLGLNANYVKTRFTRITATPASYAVGDPLDSFPKYTYNVSVQRDFRWSEKTAFTRVDYGVQGRMTYRNRFVSTVPSPWYFSQSDIINMLNAHAGLQWNASLSLGLFAQNILNDRGFTSPNTIENVAARARPRTYGVDFSFAF